jgi:hypothetical protein
MGCVCNEKKHRVVGSRWSVIFDNGLKNFYKFSTFAIWWLPDLRSKVILTPRREITSSGADPLRNYFLVLSYCYLVDIHEVPRYLIRYIFYICQLAKFGSLQSYSKSGQT